MDSVTLSWNGLVLKYLNAVVMADSPAVLDELSMMSFQLRLCAISELSKGALAELARIYTDPSVSTRANPVKSRLK